MEFHIQVGTLLQIPLIDRSWEALLISFKKKAKFSTQFKEDISIHLPFK